MKFVGDHSCGVVAFVTAITQNNSSVVPLSSSKTFFQWLVTEISFAGIGGLRVATNASLCACI